MEEASGKHLAHPLGWVSLFRSLLRELFNAAIAGDATASRGESERITAGQNPICTVCRTGFPFPSRCKHTRVKGRTHHETGLRFSRQGALKLLLLPVDALVPLPSSASCKRIVAAGRWVSVPFLASSRAKQEAGWLAASVTVTSIAKTTAVQQSKNISYYRQRENALKNPLNILNYYYFTIKSPKGSCARKAGQEANSACAGQLRRTHVVGLVQSMVLGNLWQSAGDVDLRAEISLSDWEPHDELATSSPRCLLECLPWLQYKKSDVVYLPRRHLNHLLEVIGLTCTAEVWASRAVETSDCLGEQGGGSLYRGLKSMKRCPRSHSLPDLAINGA
ncbi:hypothetical protein Anapl_04649 [Anas platyrhynchos]|uniref:Uncharacterized protein n=1 Tax=Anas platyrhynchos TaxID=8839 RepID=R0LEH4_ANAPL|nr:hypothetical protein Anapl_04649 [Anas platyrhynchos]